MFNSLQFTEAQKASKTNKSLADKYRNELEVLRGEVEEKSRALQHKTAELEEKTDEILSLNRQLADKEEELWALEKKIPTEKTVMRLIQAQRRMQEHRQHSSSSSNKGSSVLSPKARNVMPASLVVASTSQHCKVFSSVLQPACLDTFFLFEFSFLRLASFGYFLHTFFFSL